MAWRSGRLNRRGRPAERQRHFLGAHRERMVKKQVQACRSKGEVRVRPSVPVRALANTRVLILVHDLDVRIINAATGELLRELVLDPARDYQPTGKPRRRPKRNNPEP